jgi:hypothetical protein
MGIDMNKNLQRFYGARSVEKLNEPTWESPCCKYFSYDKVGSLWRTDYAPEKEPRWPKQNAELQGGGRRQKTSELTIATLRHIL